RWRGQHQLSVRVPAFIADASPEGESATDNPANWQQVPALGWEVSDARIPAALHLGTGVWEKDEHSLQQLLQTAPRKLRWQVNATRSPVAELGDLIALARQAGVQQQALQLLTDAATDPRRHIASWRAFANRQQLVWLQEQH